MSSSPPGWYYAQGDPVGTQRYWDGMLWQGGPEQASIQPGQIGQSDHDVGATPSRAEHGPRFVAALIDVGIAVGLWLLTLVGTALAVNVSEPLAVVIFFGGTVSEIGFACYNHVYLQGRKGQTIGKKSQNLKLVSKQTGGPVGIGKAIARWVLSVLFNWFFFMDLIWILIDGQNRTLSDKVLGTRVVAVQRQVAD